MVAPGVCHDSAPHDQGQTQYRRSPDPDASHQSYCGSRRRT
jgi:hypothetical protein